MSITREKPVLEAMLSQDASYGTKGHVIVTKSYIACNHDDNAVNDNGLRNSVTNDNRVANSNARQDGVMNSTRLNDSITQHAAVANDNGQPSVANGNSGGTKSSNPDTVIYFDDVIGCHCQQVEGSESDQDVTSVCTAVCLTVHYYPHGPIIGGAKHSSRSRQTLTFLFDQYNAAEKNIEEASLWQRTIQNLARNLSSNPGLEGMTSLDLRQMLVIVNPFSGRMKGEQTFKEIVQPMLNEANIKYHVIVTRDAGHAMKYVHDTCVDNWSGIVVVSGDGLVHEVVNGLMTRRDWRTAIKTPLGVVPAGSGNALSASLLYSAGESCVDNFEMYATFHVLKQTPAPLDLMSVDMGSGRRLYSFLQLAWGLVSDVDIESERYRSLGSARITLCAIIRIANLRRYRGRVSFLPVDPNYKPKRPLVRAPRGSVLSPFERVVSGNDQPVQSRVNDSKRAFQHYHDHRASNGESESSDINTDSEEEWVAEAETFYDAADDDERTLKDEDGENEQNNYDDINRVNNLKEFSATSFTKSKQRFEGYALDDDNDCLDVGDEIERRYLPESFIDPVPDDWMTMEEDFVSIIANVHTHASRDLIFAPGARADDGCIHLLMAYNGLSRLDLVRLLSEGDTTRLAAGPNLEVIKVKAFRIIPLTPGEIMTVDGERVEYGPIQAEVLPSLGRVMSTKPCGSRQT